MRAGILLGALALTVGNLPLTRAADANTATKHKPPTVLLIGASGMIGSRILEEAVARGHYVIAASRHPEKIASGPDIHPVKLDATDGRHVVDTLPAAYQGEARAMRNFLDTLKTTDINWTFFSPAFSIAPGTRTDKFRIGTTTLLTDDKGESRISAEDYADALVTELETPAHERAQMTIAY